MAGEGPCHDIFQEDVVETRDGGRVVIQDVYGIHVSGFKALLLIATFPEISDRAGEGACGRVCKFNYNKGLVVILFIFRAY